MKRLSGDQKNGGAPEAFKDPEGRGGETPVRPLAQKGKAGAAGNKDLSLRHGRVPLTVRSQRQIVGYAGGLDSGQRAHAGDDLLEDFAAFCLPRFFGGGTIVVIDFETRSDQAGNRGRRRAL